jgi:hypothetical protein
MCNIWHKCCLSWIWLLNNVQHNWHKSCLFWIWLLNILQPLTQVLSFLNLVTQKCATPDTNASPDTSVVFPEYGYWIVCNIWHNCCLSWIWLLNIVQHLTQVLSFLNLITQKFATPDTSVAFPESGYSIICNNWHQCCLFWIWLLNNMQQLTQGVVFPE